MIQVSDDQLNLYLSIFKGRTDVYARYWEKNGRSGYSPAYSFDWDESFLRFIPLSLLRTTKKRSFDVISRQLAAR